MAILSPHLAAPQSRVNSRMAFTGDSPAKLFLLSGIRAPSKKRRSHALSDFSFLISDYSEKKEGARRKITAPPCLSG